MKIHAKIFGIFLVALQMIVGAGTLQASPPISLDPVNPHYFLFRGQPTVLVASSEHYGSVVNLDFDYLTYLNEIASKHLNYTRVWTGSYVEYQGWFGIPNNTMAPAAGRFLAPWARSSTPGYANGGNKFDLSQFDPNYFARLQDYVAQASSRGIVVEVSLFCSYYTTQLWQLSPLYEGNNINGVNGGGGDGTLAYTLNNGNLGPVQDAFVKKVITSLNGYDNVVYEICNELYADTPGDWSSHIADVITQTEATLPNKHVIMQNINNGAVVVPYANPEVSVFNFHYATPDAVAMNANLPDVIGFDETGGGSADIIYRQEGWDFLMAGGALFDNLDYSFTVASPSGATNQPSAPGGGSPDLRTQLGVLLAFMNSLDFLHMTPDTSTITGGVPSGATIHALSEAGKQYAVFLEGPDGNNQADLVANLPAANYLVEWVNTHTGSVDKSETFTHPGGSRTLVSPTYLDDIALRITVNGTQGGGGGGGTLPSPWSDQDIGSVGAAGSASYSSGAFTIAGAGADIWGTADAFHYVYQPVNGDCSITARVASLVNTNANAKAAVMIRSDLSAGSAHAMIDVSPTGGVEFICRTSAGAGAIRPAAISGAAPYWVRMTRAGNIFTAYASSDGSTWTTVGSQTITMGTGVYIGLPVCSHVSGTLTTAVIDNVTLATGGGGSVPAITSNTTASGTVGSAFSYQITASNSPTSYNATGLPGGLSVNTGTGAISGTPSAAGTSNITLSAINTSGTGTATLVLTVNSGGGGGSLPSPWLDQDIGSVGAAGSASYASGAYTIAGAGADIWGTADAFNYVYQPISGDCSITARVASLVNTNANAKAAVMIRSDLTAGSAHAMIDVSPGGGVEFICRTSSGAGAIRPAAVSGVAPYWVRLTRAGNLFTVYSSPDGTTWTTVGSQTITMGTAVYIGMPVCSHVAGTLTTAVIDNVTVASGGGGSGLPSPWTNQDVGSVGFAGSASYSGGVFTVTGSGADIWGTADGFQYVSQTVTGTTHTIIARATTPSTSGGTQPVDGKTGIMFRDTTAAGSEDVYLAYTNTLGVQFIFRTITGSGSAQGPIVSASFPVWLKLVKNGSSFTAFYGSDGVNWTQLGTAETISFTSSNYLAGLISCSHDNTKTATTTLDNVSVQ